MRDAETGCDYFGVRYYDSGLSVWLSVDPLADKYPNESPYCYAGWNPVMITDPNGMWKGEVDKNGKTTYVAEKGDMRETFREQYSDLSRKDVEYAYKFNDKLVWQKGAYLRLSTPRKNDSFISKLFRW